MRVFHEFQTIRTFINGLIFIIYLGIDENNDSHLVRLDPFISLNEEEDTIIRLVRINSSARDRERLEIP